MVPVEKENVIHPKSLEFEHLYVQGVCEFECVEPIMKLLINK